MAGIASVPLELGRKSNIHDAKKPDGDALLNNWITVAFPQTISRTIVVALLFHQFEMPIPFSSIPGHLKISIVQKQDLQDFVNFHRTSRRSYLIAQTIKTRYTIPGNDCYFTDIYFSWDILIQQGCKMYYADDILHLPVRLETHAVRILQNITEDFCVLLKNLVEATKSRLERLFTNNITCSPKSFNLLLFKAKTRSLNVSHSFSISPSLLRVPAIRHLQGLRCTSELEDKDLAFLKMPYLTLKGTDISGEGINSLLKDWRSQERRIDMIEIHARRRFENDKIFDGIVQKPKGSGSLKMLLSSTWVKISKDIN